MSHRPGACLARSLQPCVKERGGYLIQSHKNSASPAKADILSPEIRVPVTPARACPSASAHTTIGAVAEDFPPCVGAPDTRPRTTPIASVDDAAIPRTGTGKIAKPALRERATALLEE